MVQAPLVSDQVEPPLRIFVALPFSAGKKKFKTDLA